MKRIFTIIAAVLLGTSAASAQKLDMLDFDFPFANKVMGKKQADYDPKLLGLGASFASESVSFNPSNSLDFFVYSTESASLGRHFEVDYGFGLEWKNFGMTDEHMLSKNTDATISWGTYPATAVPRSSRVRVFSLGFPVLLSCNLYNGFGFSVGPVFNVNLGSKIINKYTVDGDKHKDKIKDVHHNLATVDLLAELNLKEVAIFVKYSPMNTLDKAYWPGFETWTFGIAF